MESLIIAFITYYANVYGVDPQLAVSVARVESSLNPNAKGSAGEIGLFQIKPSSVPHVRPEDLFDPAINAREGVKYLAWNKKYCNHKEDKTFLVCYNYGIENAKKVKHPKLFPYYKKVMGYYKDVKYDTARRGW